MIELLELQIDLPDIGVLKIELNATETRRVISSVKVTKVGLGFIHQDNKCRDYWELIGGISGDVEITYFEMGNVSNNGFLYRGLTKSLIGV